MELTTQQQQAIAQGNPVTVLINRTPCVVVRKDVYDQTRAGGDDPRATYGAVLKAWDSDDENPDQYAEYLQDA